MDQRPNQSRLLVAAGGRSRQAAGRTATRAAARDKPPWWGPGWVLGVAGFGLARARRAPLQDDVAAHRTERRKQRTVNPLML
jgi:hypothetical protein